MYTLAAVWHPLLTCIHTYRCTGTAVLVLTAAQSNVRSLFLYCMCVCAYFPPLLLLLLLFSWFNCRHAYQEEKASLKKQLKRLGKEIETMR